MLCVIAWQHLNGSEFVGNGITSHRLLTLIEKISYSLETVHRCFVLAMKGATAMIAAKATAEVVEADIQAKKAGDTRILLKPIRLKDHTLNTYFIPISTKSNNNND